MGCASVSGRQSKSNPCPVDYNAEGRNVSGAGMYVGNHIVAADRETLRSCVSVSGRQSKSNPRPVDYNAEGRKVLASRGASLNVDTSDISCLWKQPVSGASMYVGNHIVAADRETLRKLNIQRVVVCLDSDHEARPFETESNFKYLHFPIAHWQKCPQSEDIDGIARLCAPLLGFVAESLRDGFGVLIHCLAGAHRAGTAGIACLMQFEDLAAAEAITRAKVARPVIDPIGELRPLLLKLEAARKASAIENWIELAASLGFTAAAADLFHGNAYVVFE